MFAVSPMMVVWCGRVSGGLLFVSGTSQLLPVPPLPSIMQELHAMFLWVAAMVPLTIGEFVAFYLTMLKTIPINPRGIDAAAKLQRQVFDVFGDGATSITKIFKATAGLRSSDRKNEVSRERTPQS